MVNLEKASGTRQGWCTERNKYIYNMLYGTLDDIIIMWSLQKWNVMPPHKLDRHVRRKT